MYVVALLYKEYDYEIIYITSEYKDAKKIYNLFLDKKVCIMEIDQEKIKHIGSSMRLSDLYFNLGDYNETIIVKNF